jgi:hypothetical protein
MEFMYNTDLEKYYECIECGHGELIEIQEFDSLPLYENYDSELDYEDYISKKPNK